MNAVERCLQEPSEPDALALAFLADAVHAVVPVAGTEQRQTVLSDLQRVIEPPGAVLEQRGALLGDPGHEEGVMLLGMQGAAFEKRNPFVEYRRIAGRLEVLADAVSEPDHVIADPGAHALAGRAGGDGREPPMLHVAFGELARACAEQVLPREIRPA